MKFESLNFHNWILPEGKLTLTTLLLALIPSVHATPNLPVIWIYIYIYIGEDICFAICFVLSCIRFLEIEVLAVTGKDILNGYRLICVNGTWCMSACTVCLFLWLSWDHSEQNYTRIHIHTTAQQRFSQRGRMVAGLVPCIGERLQNSVLCVCDVLVCSFFSCIFSCFPTSPLLASSEYNYRDCNLL